MQVPDEIMNLMDDPFVIAGGTNADLSTKEILKRYQDRLGQKPVGPVEFSEAHNRQDEHFRPPPTRVETDPTLYKEARSVRPVQDPPQPFNGSVPGTPPQMWKGASDNGHPSPYKHEQFNHSDPQLEPAEGSQRREWRNSGWGRQYSGVGVGGNT